MNQHTETYTFFITAFSLAVVELLDYKRQRRLEVQSISALFEMKQLYTESTPKSTQRPPSPWMRLCSSYVVCVCMVVCVLVFVCWLVCVVREALRALVCYAKKVLLVVVLHRLVLQPVP